MKKLVLILAIVLLSPITIAAQAKISGMTARLFYSENSESKDKKSAGTFSENIIGNPGFELWNTIIGEGSATGYSDQTIVFVEITPASPNTDYILNFTANSNKKSVSKQQKRFSIISGKSKHYIAFMLDNTGCDKISLKADLISKNKIISSLTKSLDFKCGE